MKLTAIFYLTFLLSIYSTNNYLLAEETGLPKTSISILNIDAKNKAVAASQTIIVQRDQYELAGYTPRLLPHHHELHPYKDHCYRLGGSGTFG